MHDAPQSMATGRTSLASRGFLIASLAVSIFVTLYPVLNRDIYWHMANGREMLNQGRIINEEIFSYTVPGKHFHNNEWLAQVLFYKVFELGSHNGLLLLKALIVSVTVLFLFRTAALMGASPAIAFLIVLAVMLVGVERYKVRPHLFTLLFASYLQYALFAYRSGRINWRWLLPVPIVFGLWDVLHHSQFGLIYFGAFLAGETIRSLMARKAAGPLAESPYSLKRLYMAFGLTLLVFVVSPYGLRTSDIFLKAVSDKEVIFALTSEFMPTAFENNRLFWALMALTGALAVAFYRRLDFTLVLTLIPFAVLGIKFTRETAMFALIAVPALGYYGGIIRASSGAPLIRKIYRGAAILLAASLLGYAVFFKLFAAGNPMRLGTGYNRAMYPAGAANFIEGAGLAGNMFNREGLGGYLCYRLYPDRRIFLYNLGGTFDEVVGSLHSRAFLEKHSINYGIVSDGWMLQLIFDQAGWARVYWDDVAAVVLKRTPENAALIDEYELKHYMPGIRKEALAEMERDPALRAGLMRELSRILAYGEDPGRAKYLSYLLLLNKEPVEPETLKWTRMALLMNPESAELANALGQIYYKAGDSESAYKTLERALMIDPGSGMALTTLGYMDYERGAYEAAAGRFKNAIALEPSGANAYFGLGLSYEKANEFSLASDVWKRYLELEPSGQWADKARLHLEFSRSRIDAMRPPH